MEFMIIKKMGMSIFRMALMQCFHCDVNLINVWVLNYLELQKVQTDFWSSLIFFGRDFFEVSARGSAGKHLQDHTHRGPCYYREGVHAFKIKANLTHHYLCDNDNALRPCNWVSWSISLEFVHNKETGDTLFTFFFFYTHTLNLWGT